LYDEHSNSQQTPEAPPPPPAPARLRPPPPAPTPAELRWQPVLRAEAEAAYADTISKTAEEQPRSVATRENQKKHKKITKTVGDCTFLLWSKSWNAYSLQLFGEKHSSTVWAEPSQFSKKIN
jgi:hypothetical protein